MGNVRQDADGTNKVTALHTCILLGNRTDLKRLLEEGDASIEAKDHFGRTPLFYCVMVDNSQFLSLLLKVKARVDNADNGGQTALHLAARKGLKGCIKLLLAANALWDQRDAEGVTSLHLAASNRKPQGLALLLGQVLRGQVDLQDGHKRTALHWSAQFCNADCIVMLLKEDANVLLQDEEGRTPLHLCAARPDPAAVDCVRLLLECEPSLIRWQDYQGCTALHQAVATGTIQTVDFLTSRGQCNSLDNLFRTPLHWAVQLGRVDVVRLLLGRHADPGGADCHGATPLHYASRLRDPALTSLLLSRGSPTDPLDSKGFSPLMWAAVGGATAHLRALHHHKVPLDAPTPDGVTALHAAAGEGQDETVQLLLDLGMGLGLRDHLGLAPLSYACHGGHAHTVLLLVDAGAQLHDTDARGCSPLHWAVAGDHAYVCQLLAQRGCRMDMVDHQGRGALHYASGMGLVSCVAALLQYGAEPNLMDIEGKAPVHLAAHCGSLESVELLRGHGAMLNAMDKTPHRYTALDYARMGNHSSVVNFLLEQGATSSSNIKSIAAFAIQRFFRRLCKKQHADGVLKDEGEHLGRQGLPDIKEEPVHPGTSAAPCKSQAAVDKPPSDEHKAALVIQRAWHRYTRCRQLERMQERIQVLFSDEVQRQEARREWQQGLAHFQLFTGVWPSLRYRP
ncbi:unnamed protein product [Ixodes pacificus]